MVSERGVARWLLVVGAHRSGTSAVTGALSTLGFTAPSPEDRIDWPESNPEHWESVSLSVFNERLLQRLGGSWDGPPELSEGWMRSPAMHDVADPADLLTRAFPGSEPAVWKDPRVCLLLEYWRSVLDDPIACVLVWRAPLAVAQSLWQRDQMPLTDGLALWEHYNRSAIECLNGVDTYVVRFESMLEDPKRFVGDLAGWLGSLAQFKDRTERWDLDKATASIDHDLQHQPIDNSRDASALLQDEQRQLVDQLTHMGGGHRPFRQSSPLAESTLTSAVIRLRRELAATRRAHEDLARSNRTIEQMRESMSWRVTKPMRFLMATIRRGSKRNPG